MKIHKQLIKCGDYIFIYHPTKYELFEIKCINCEEIDTEHYIHASKKFVKRMEEIRRKWKRKKPRIDAFKGKKEDVKYENGYHVYKMDID